MGLLDIFKTDELKARISELEKQLNAASVKNKDLTNELKNQKNSYEQKLKNQEKRYQEIISNQETIISVYERSNINNDTDNDVSSDVIALESSIGLDSSDVEKIYKSNTDMQMAQVKALANPAQNNFKVSKDSKGIIIDKYIGDEELVTVPPIIDRQIVYKIGDQAFQNCKNTKIIELPDTIIAIGNGAFSGSGLEQIALPKKLESIGKQAFISTNLTEIKLPAAVKEIGSHAFSRTKIKQLLIPKNVKEIPNEFLYSTELELVVIEGAVKIGKKAFSGHSIKSIVLPEGLKTIEEEAFNMAFRFRWEDGIVKIIIPKTVEKIDRYNFDERQHIALLNENTEIVYGWSAFRPHENNYNDKIILYCNNGGIAFEQARANNVCIKPLSEFQNIIINDSKDEDDNEESEKDDIDPSDDKDTYDDNEDDSNDNSGDNDEELDTSSWSLESILRREGYTVSQKEDLSDYERQQILLSVMRRNLMSKWQIIEHIELQISLRKNNKMYDIAISKWERDLSFLRKI